MVISVLIGATPATIAGGALVIVRAAIRNRASVRRATRVDSAGIIGRAGVGGGARVHILTTVCRTTALIHTTPV